MSKYLIAVLVGVFTLLFSFQNCQKSPQSEDVLTQFLSAKPEGSEADLSQASIEALDVITKDSKVMVSQSGHNIQLIYDVVLKINLKTGLMTELNEQSSGAVQYCLTQSLRDELVTLLKSSYVCKTQPEIDPSVLCTQVLQPEYARVYTTQNQYNLGSATDGCGHNKIDLCGEQADLLKGFIANLKVNYKQMTCPQ